MERDGAEASAQCEEAKWGQCRMSIPLCYLALFFSLWTYVLCPLLFLSSKHWFFQNDFFVSFSFSVLSLGCFPQAWMQRCIVLSGCNIFNHSRGGSTQILYHYLYNTVEIYHYKKKETYKALSVKSTMSTLCRKTLPLSDVLYYHILDITDVNLSIFFLL